MRHGHPSHHEEEEFTIPSETHGFLWMHKLKATKPRLELFELLSKEKEPLSAANIYKKIGAKGTRATIFRTLEQFCKTGLAVKIQNPLEDHSLYEINCGRPHHHHATCTLCGDTEDVSGCDPKDLDASACAHLKKFKSIQSHSLEFFGLCRTCEGKQEK